MANGRLCTVWVALMFTSLCARNSRAVIAAGKVVASQPTEMLPPPREPVVGVGYHVGNFIGPLAIDVIVRPLPHLAIDIQAGYSRESASPPGQGPSPLNTFGLAPHLQWELWRGLKTPYLSGAFRYEWLWREGATAVSRGGCLIGGWQMRWRSGFGFLVGIGVLYKSEVTLRGPGFVDYEQGGFVGTYELGVRYFF